MSPYVTRSRASQEGLTSRSYRDALQGAEAILLLLGSEFTSH